MLDEDRYEGMLDVFCEAPTEIHRHGEVRLVDPASGQVWNQQLGDSMGVMSYPVRTWLSPLNRSQTFFHLVEAVRTDSEMRWVVPRGALSGAKLGFMPRQAAGCEIFKYEIRDVKLEDFVAKRPLR